MGTNWFNVLTDCACIDRLIMLVNVDFLITMFCNKKEFRKSLLWCWVGIHTFQNISFIAFYYYHLSWKFYILCVYFISYKSLSSGEILRVCNILKQNWYKILYISYPIMGSLILWRRNSEAYQNLETKWSVGSINYNKNTRELQTLFDWVCTWGIINTCNIHHAP
jgi:hypothetical protein